MMTMSNQGKGASASSDQINTVNIAGGACHPAGTAGSGSVPTLAERQPTKNASGRSGRGDVSQWVTSPGGLPVAAIASCEHCGAYMEVKRASGPKRKRYCSGACRVAAFRVRHGEAGGGRAGVFVWLALLALVVWFVWPSLTAAREWFNGRPLVVSVQQPQPATTQGGNVATIQQPQPATTQGGNVATIQQPQPAISAATMARLEANIAQAERVLEACQTAQRLNPSHNYRCERPKQALETLQQQRQEVGGATSDRRGNAPKLAASSPHRITIPEVGLDVSIAPYPIDQTPATGAGWWAERGRPGDGDNVVIWGHNYSAFAPLERAHVGQMVNVYAGTAVYTYRLTDRLILPEEGQPLDVRYENGRLTLDPTGYERLTLITCWPFPNSNQDRLVFFGELVGVNYDGNS